MGNASLAHTSHPFWSAVLSITGLLDPHAVSFVVKRPQSPSEKHLRAAAPQQATTFTPVPAPQNHHRFSSGVAETNSDGTRCRNPQAAAMRRSASISGNDAAVDLRASSNHSRSDSAHLDQTIPHAEPTSECHVREKDHEPKIAQARKVIPNKLSRAAGKCKQWLKKAKGSKQNVPGNRDSQQYVAEWVEEVHSATDAESVVIQHERAQKLRSGLGTNNLRDKFRRMRHKTDKSKK